MKKVLIITYYWPPSGGSGVQRWLKFAKYLRGFSWESIIYTPHQGEFPVIDKSLEKDVPQNLEIIKTPIREPYNLYKKITGNKDAQTVSFLKEGKSGIIQKMFQWVRGNFFIPDPRIFWVKPSIKFLAGYLKENPVNIVVTTGPPHSLHLIGLGLKRKLNVTWVADFRDPWTNIDYYKDLYLTKWADKRHRELEKDVLSTADTVVTVGETLANELQNLGAKRTVVITNGYDSDDYKSVSSASNDFSFVHVGLLSKTRSHPALWRAFANFLQKIPEAKSELKIKLVGKTDYSAIQEIKRAGIEAFVEKINYVDHEEVVRIQQGAWIFLLPINRTPNSKGIISGKIFEYMAAGKPILAIGDTDGDVAQIISDSNSGVIFDFDDVSGISGYMEKMYLEFKRNFRQVSTSNIEKYSRRELTQKLARELNHLSG